jgi:short-subunit dehydrogenase
MRIQQDGGTAAAIPLDLGRTTDFAAFRDAVQATLLDYWGQRRLGGMVNNAGYGLLTPIADVTEAQFDGLMDVHLKGSWRTEEH